MMKDHYPFSQFLGVDVSKATLDFAFADANKSHSVENAEEEIVSQLIGKINDSQSTIVVMEATGGYEQRLGRQRGQDSLMKRVLTPYLCWMNITIRRITAPKPAQPTAVGGMTKDQYHDQHNHTQICTDQRSGFSHQGH